MVIGRTNIKPFKYFRDGMEITEPEYHKILEIIKNKPTAPTGYEYRLTDSLEWELHELPVVPVEEEEATEEDYLQALERLGVVYD